MNNIFLLLCQFVWLVIEEDRSCKVALSASPLHIALSSSSKLSCGTLTQPWMLEASAGQQINVSLLDFGKMTENNLQSTCRNYGYIFDRSSSKNVSICVLHDRRENLLHTSASNVITIVLGTQQRNDDANSQPIQFLIRFAGI